MSENSFEAVTLSATGASGITSFPWAHSSGMLSALVRQALAVDAASLGSGRRPVRIDPFSAFPPENHFAKWRAQNAISFFLVDAFDLVPASRTIARAFPGSWTWSHDGLGAKEQVALAAPPDAGLPLHLDATGWEPYFDTSNGLEPVTQIDELGRIWALSITAAARVLGCPAALSVSVHGLNSILGLGDIIGCANKMAAKDGATFEIQFKNAIVALPDSSESVLTRNITDAHLLFIERDRTAVLHECIPSHAATLVKTGLRL